RRRFAIEGTSSMRNLNVTVVGAGTMGNGIAHVFAQHGHSVRLFDVREDALARALETIVSNLDRQLRKGIIEERTRNATLGRIRTESDLEQAAGSADVVVEAATEEPDVKAAIFRELDETAPERAILASNTS